MAPLAWHGWRSRVPCALPTSPKMPKSPSSAVITMLGMTIDFDVVSTYFPKIPTEFVVAPLSLSVHCASPRFGRCAHQTPKMGFPGLGVQHLWILYTGMQWQCLPVPQDPTGTPAIHYTTVYKVFAKWADDGSLWQAFIASVTHLSAEKHLDLRVLHGDGTNTVAKKGGMALATRGTNTRRARRSLPSPTIIDIIGNSV
jgi:hypothetical protein